jgi:hypothetical protein
MLLNMGFSEADRVAAFAATDADDVDAALEWLSARQALAAEEQESAAAAASHSAMECQEQRASRAVGYECDMAGIRSRQQRVSDMQSEDGRIIAVAQRQAAHLKRLEEYKAHLGVQEAFPGQGVALEAATDEPFHRPQLYPYDNGGYEAEEAALQESRRKADRLLRQQQVRPGYVKSVACTACAIFYLSNMCVTYYPICYTWLVWAISAREITIQALMVPFQVERAPVVVCVIYCFCCYSAL